MDPAIFILLLLLGCHLSRGQDRVDASGIVLLRLPFDPYFNYYEKFCCRFYQGVCLPFVDNRGYAGDIYKGRISLIEYNGCMDVTIWNLQKSDGGLYRCAITDSPYHVYKDFIVVIPGPKPGPGPIPPTRAATDPTPTEKTTPRTTTITTPTPVDPALDACRVDKFDTITLIQQELHLFKDGQYWKVSQKNGIKGPYRTSETWPALPSTIDSAFEDLLTKKLYFFSGRRVWVYTRSSVLEPQSLEKLGLPGSLEHVEGALQRGKGKALLFVGKKYWRLDVKTQTIDEGYPRDVEQDFGDVFESPAHDVFLYKGHTYFCRERYYWRVNSRRQVDRVGYIKYDVLKCPVPSHHYW